MEKLLLIIEVHQLKKKGFKIAAIANKLGISRNTVYKYLDMTFEEAIEYLNSCKSRSKKLDTYQKDILYWLKDNPDMSSAQVEDWLKEKYPELTIGSSTVRSYVSGIRDIHHLPKAIRTRNFEAVEELPMGGNRFRWIGGLHSIEASLLFSSNRYKNVELREVSMDKSCRLIKFICVNIDSESFKFLNTIDRLVISSV